MIQASRHFSLMRAETGCVDPNRLLGGRDKPPT